MKEIKEDKNISIYPFDKGSGFVRINNDKAISKIQEQLGDTILLDTDPTPSFATEVRTTLCDLNRKKRFTKNEYNRLYPSDPIPPRMYGTIKAHKVEKGYPMRTVVSTVGTPTYGISQYLVELIQPVMNKNETKLKNSSTFVNEAKMWEISSQEVQVSYDIVNLYPSVPLKEATNILLEMLAKDNEYKSKTKLQITEIKLLIELCLSRCYFLWNDKIYALEDSGPIGLSLMVVMAESFVQHIESKAINVALLVNPPIALKSLRRFVDDIHARFSSLEEADKFKDILNKQHPKIQYTIEREDKDKVLNFLDVKIKNNKQGKYEFSIHRKKAITNIQVKKHSSHDPNIQTGIIKGFVNRALTICSEIHIEEELKFLIDMFIENGYESSEVERIITQVRNKRRPNIEIPTQPDKKTITLPWIPGVSPKLRKAYKKAGYKTVFKSSNNLKNILTSKNKTKLPRNSYPGVYKIDCICTKLYTGETKLKICTRGSQHHKNTMEKKIDKSGIALHSSECEKEIDWENIKTIKVEYNRFERKVREALEIQYHECGPKKGGMNLDDGQYVKTKFWTPLFKYLREKQIDANNDDIAM